MEGTSAAPEPDRQRFSQCARRSWSPHLHARAEAQAPGERQPCAQRAVEDLGNVRPYHPKWKGSGCPLSASEQGIVPSVFKPGQSPFTLAATSREESSLGRARGRNRK